jgi:FAD/FMN-containing dehydrogenase
LATDVRRRRLLKLAAAAALSAAGPATVAARAQSARVNDVTGLNSVRVARELRPRSADEVRSALREWNGAVSVGGGRYSMGGQIVFPDSLHVDMRSMSRVLRLDPSSRIIRVQAGASWRDIQERIDPHELSVKIMQSYSNFTVGGSETVNSHGR